MAVKICFIISILAGYSKYWNTIRRIYSGSVIPELQNRVTHYDVTNRVTNSKILFFKIFRVSNSMWKKLSYSFRVSNSRFLKKMKFQSY